MKILMGTQTRRNWRRTFVAYLTVVSMAGLISLPLNQDVAYAANPSLNLVQTVYAGGLAASGVAVDPATDTVYLTANTNTTDFVAVMDGNTGVVSTTIPVGSTPMSLLMDSTSHRLFVSNYDSAKVSVIDTDSKTVIGEVVVGSKPSHMALNHNTNSLYVSNQTSNTISVVDMTSFAVTSTIPLASLPGEIEVDEATNTLYVTQVLTGMISIVDVSSATVTSTIATGAYPSGLVLDLPNDRIFVANNYGAKTVKTINLTTKAVTQTVTLTQTSLEGLVYEPASNILFVTSRSGYVSTIDVATGTGSSWLSVGTTPSQLAVNPLTNRVFIARGAGYVAVVSFAFPAELSPSVQGAISSPIGTSMSSSVLSATRFTGDISYNVSPALPAGLTLSSTGVISGTPVTPQAAINYTITGVGSLGGQAVSTVSITVEALLTPQTQSFSQAVGTSLSSSSLTSDGFAGAVSYTVTPALPAGLSLSSLGVISGTPTVAQNSTVYTITGTGATSGVAYSRLSLEFLAVISPTTQTSINSPVGYFINSENLTTQGISGAITYSVSPTLPLGLVISSTTGVISGTPTETKALTTYSITASGATSGVAVSTVSMNIVGVGLSPTTQIAVLGRVGSTSSSQSLAKTGFVGSVSFAVSPNLPAGYSLNTTTGVIEGTPLAAQLPIEYTITATGSTFGSATSTVLISVSPVLSPAVQNPIVSTFGTHVSTAVLTSSGFTSTVSYTVSPSLPAGMSLNTTNGQLSGTPARAQGSTSYTITGSDGVFSQSSGVTFSVTALLPGSPTALSGVGGNGQALVRWTPGDDGGSPVTFTVSALNLLGTEVSSCTTQNSFCVVTDLLPDTSYNFTVTARNTAGSSHSILNSGTRVTTPSAPLLAPGNSLGMNPPSIFSNGQISPSLLRGQEVVITSGGFVPGSVIDFFAYSTPTYLGSGRADANGAITKTLTIPQSLANGQHTLVVSGISTSGQQAYSVGYFVVSDGAMSSLSNTGFGLDRWLVLLTACLLVGAVLLVASRKNTEVIV